MLLQGHTEVTECQLGNVSRGFTLLIKYFCTQCQI